MPELITKCTILQHKDVENVTSNVQLSYFYVIFQRYMFDDKPSHHNGSTINIQSGSLHCLQGRNFKIAFLGEKS